MAKINFNINGEINNSILGTSIKTTKFVMSEQFGTNNSDKNEDLLFQIVDKAVRMMERKHTKKIEDLHNDDFTDWLRDRGFQVSDQTRSGKSQKTSGELDIMIRKENGTPFSIIEAFRLSSCGDSNSTISFHVNKLVNDYDTAGHKTNFIIVYAESARYSDLWQKYITYIKNIETKKGYDKTSQLLSFFDTEEKYCKVTDVRVGEALHKREEKTIQIFHVFVNMYVK